MLKLDPNKKLVRQHFEEKIEKTSIMHHERHTQHCLEHEDMKKKQLGDSSSTPVCNLCDGATNKYPYLDMEMVIEVGTVAGICFQDDQMKSSFQRFPKLLLIDATYNILTDFRVCKLVVY